MYNKGRNIRASETAQWVKSLAAKADAQSLISETHIVRENLLLYIELWLLPAHCDTTHRQTQMNVIKILRIHFTEIVVVSSQKLGIALEIRVVPWKVAIKNYYLN